VRTWRCSVRACLVLGLVTTGAVVDVIHPVVAAAAASRLDVATSATLNCNIQHNEDATLGFFSGSSDHRADRACGTFVAIDGQVFGPSAIPGGFQGVHPMAFTPISQTGVTGNGTSWRPFTIVTRVGAGSTGIIVVQTDTWTATSEIVSTRIDVFNQSGVRHAVVLSRAGDCQDGTYFSFGRVRPGKAACIVAAQDGAHRDVGRLAPGEAIVQFAGIGATGLVDLHGEIGFGSVMEPLLSAGLPMTGWCASCDPDVASDRSLGVSWPLDLRARRSVTVRSTTTMSTGATRSGSWLVASVDRVDAGVVIAQLGAAKAAWRSGQLIRFLRDGSLVCAAYTDRRGTARCPVPAPPVAGSDPTGQAFGTTNVVEVMFDGTLDVRPATATVALAGPDVLTDPATAVTPDCLPEEGAVVASGSLPGSMLADVRLVAPSCSTLRYALVNQDGSIVYLIGDGSKVLYLQLASSVGQELVVTRLGLPDVVLARRSVEVVSPGKFNG